MTNPPLAPTAPGDRSPVPDAVRGFAFFGIVAANFVPSTAADSPASLLVFALAKGKFFTLFSLLFGYGFVRFRANAAARGRWVGPAYLRRMLAIFLVGMVVVYLGGPPDVLLVYPVLGCLLLPFRRASARWLLIVALTLLLVPPLALAASDVGRAANFAAFTTIFGMFLLGAAAGRRGVLDRPANHLALLRGARFGCLLAGLPLAALCAAALAAVWRDYSDTFYFNQLLVGPLLAVGYGAAVALAAHRFGAPRLLTATGRTALTAYVLQAMGMAATHGEYGATAAEAFQAAGPAASAVVVALAIAAGCVVWLRVFERGPFEWFVGAVTYLRPPALLRRRAEPST